MPGRGAFTFSEIYASFRGMADARTSGRTPAIAVGLAVAAVVISIVAVIVVATRAAPEPAPVAAPGPGSARAAPPTPRTILATDVVRLDRDATETVTEAGGAIGIKVIDPELRDLLGLEATDVITAISGRVVKRQFDVYDALLGASTMNATALYVDVLRAGTPTLLRWQLDGDLRAARSGARAGRSRPTNPFTTAPTRPVAPVSDPLLDSITKVVDLHYIVPRATVDQLLADPALLGRSARVVPAVRNGQPDGIRLFALRARSPLAALGFANGDTLQAVNGLPVPSLDKALEVYARLKTANELTFELLRRGQPTVLKISITPP